MKSNEKRPKSRQLNGPKLKSLRVRVQHRTQMSLARKRHRHKRPYFTREEAEAFADRRNARTGLRFQHVSSYLCPYCGSWHIGRDVQTYETGRQDVALEHIRRNLGLRLIWAIEDYLEATEGLVDN